MRQKQKNWTKRTLSIADNSWAEAVELAKREGASGVSVSSLLETLIRKEYQSQLGKATPSTSLPMKLNYSLGAIEPLWFDGGLPFPEMRIERVRVHLSGQSLYIPRFLEIGDLLAYHRISPEQSAVTLLLTYHHRTVPVGDVVSTQDGWHPVPGSAVYGQIRIALNDEAIALIRRVNASDYKYEISLPNVMLNDVTPKA